MSKAEPSPKAQARNVALKKNLIARRYILTEEIEVKRKEMVTDEIRFTSDEDGGILKEIESTLLHGKIDTLRAVDDALLRLAQNRYGNCFSCGKGISENRLFALPFAVRCRKCAETRELAQAKLREVERKKASSPFAMFV